ncbi:SDR family oxidoreductase [Streptomyces sp. TRM 70361]|uniref:SDR family oxidoreductase n=1 Tax=Streptomyces sp. TRM 70361 TaxID=3116553 RepID=UPI002E7B9E00|nr:SDR family oxidoreductase [Streptomyces sp. TRM 70361]MEE1939611.1 SDR family oxidoreductase [Streptomyces sp. TRM 70361]
MTADTAAPAGVRERWVDGDGVRLRVAELGTPSAPGGGRRPTVLLLHGYPDTKELWLPVAERLADRCHVVLYDMRGCGRSTAPEPLRGGFTLERLTGDFLAVADAVSPDAPVHLVGHDWGSIQGWEFATVERTRGRIASFTSISGPSLDHLGHWFARRLTRPTPRRARQALGQGARLSHVWAMQVPVLPEVASGLLWPALARRRAGRAADGYGARRAYGDGYPTGSLPADAAHGVWLYRDNLPDRLRRPRDDAYARVPVQVITLTEDPFLSPAVHDGLERWAPHLVHRALRAGHWAPRTRPDQLAAWIGAFAGSGAERELGGDQADARAGVPVLAPVRHRARDPYAEHFGGRLVLVTGAAQGIGRSTALAFARAGARVVAVDVDAQGVARTAEHARLTGAPQAWAEVADVSDGQAMEELAERVARSCGVVDVLVNNAGIAAAGPFLEHSPDDWAAVLGTNLWGAIHGCRLFGRQMAERGQGGHIVNVVSCAAYEPTRALPAYCTSKAGALMLSEVLRAELAGEGIGVSAVCPGVVSTSILDNARFRGLDAGERERRRKRAYQMYRVRRYSPEKVADAVLRSVVRNRAVVPVSLEARGGLWLSRLAPPLLRAFARINVRAS